MCNEVLEQVKCYHGPLLGKCFNRTTKLGLIASCDKNETELEYVGHWKTSFASEDYWKKIVLQKSSSINVTGGISWRLVLCLFGVYFIVYCMLIKGKKVNEYSFKLIN